jgi:hypothetical protein
MDDTGTKVIGYTIPDANKAQIKKSLEQQKINGVSKDVINKLAANLNIQ